MQQFFYFIVSDLCGMECSFCVERYQWEPQRDAFIEPVSKACGSAPPHSRELAPFRLDGLALSSLIQPSLPSPPPPQPPLAPSVRPQRIRPDAHDDPLPPPAFKSCRRSQTYPSESTSKSALWHQLRPASIHVFTSTAERRKPHCSPCVSAGSPIAVHV